MNFVEWLEKGLEETEPSKVRTLGDLIDLMKQYYVEHPLLRDEYAHTLREMESFCFNTDCSWDTELTIVREKLQVTEYYIDQLGGIHDFPLGYNPNGVFCGECDSITCCDCPNVNKAYGHAGTLSAKELTAILTQLGKDCPKGSKITICGGAVMALKYGSRKSTADVDCVYIEPRVRNAVANVGFNLEKDWINDNAKYTSSYTDKLLKYAVHYKQFGNLEVTMIEGNQLLCMKLMSWRPNSHDREDCEFLINYMKENVTLRDIQNCLSEIYGNHSALSVDAEFWLKKKFSVSMYELDTESALSITSMVARGLLNLVDVPKEFRQQVAGYLK